MITDSGVQINRRKRNEWSVSSAVFACVCVPKKTIAIPSRIEFGICFPSGSLRLKQISEALSIWVGEVYREVSRLVKVRPRDHCPVVGLGWMEKSIKVCQEQSFAGQVHKVWVE